MANITVTITQRDETIINNTTLREYRGTVIVPALAVDTSHARYLHGLNYHYNYHITTDSDNQLINAYVYPIKAVRRGHSDSHLVRRASQFKEHVVQAALKHIGDL